MELDVIWFTVSYAVVSLSWCDTYKTRKVLKSHDISIQFAIHII